MFVLLVLFGSCITSIAVEQMVDGPIARRQLKKTVQDQLYQGKYNELEKLAGVFRKNKERLPEGVWKLQFFYEGLAAKNHSPNGWQQHFAILSKWLEEWPNSITARVAVAEAWLDFGSEVRGKAYADSVSAEGWRILAESNQKAYKLLETTPPEGADDCPERYNALLTIARTQGWERPHFEALFHEAVNFEPMYYPLYISKTIYLLPRWNGEEGEWQQFAKDAINLTPQSEGKSVYMRIVGSLLLATDVTSPGDPRLSWPTLRQGFFDVERNYPSSRWNLNVFCKWSCKFGDKETAKVLFKRIGNNPYIEAWGEREEFEGWRKWAEL